VPVTIGRYQRVLLIVGAALLLAGCPGPIRGASTDDVDRARAARLRAEPILADAVGPVRVTPGRVLSEELGWDRSEVRATVYSRSAGSASAATPPAGLSPAATPPAGAASEILAPADAETTLAGMVTGLRQRGWTVLWVSCTPPAGPTGRPDDTWRWQTYAYRVDDGVSYWASLLGNVQRDGAGYISVALRAPHHRDPANLFTDAPAGVRPGDTCIERPGLAETAEQDGVPIELSSRRDLPRARPSTDPSHR
jgi:hypothetical protein